MAGGGWCVDGGGIQLRARVPLVSGVAIALIVGSVASFRRIPDFLLDRVAESRKLVHILYSSISIADTGVGARTTHLTLEPGMLSSLARARARGSQRGATKPMPREGRGGTALADVVRYATACLRFLSFTERGTGVTRGESELSPGGPSDRRTGLVALSSLFPGSSALFRGLPAGHRWGSGSQSKWDCFWGQEFQIVPSSSIHVCLFGTRFCR